MTTMKCCSVCGEEFPCTTEYFFFRTDTHKFRNECKTCFNVKNAQGASRRLAKNPEQVKQQNREKTARYRAKNRDKVYARTREWKAKNPHKIKRYRDENKRAFVVYRERRCARERNLPDTFTEEQWLYALAHFKHCCAVCGRPLSGLFHKAAADHWIPLSSSDCPGTIATNIVPLCHGVDGCNNSKSNRHPEKWLVVRYGQRRAKQILKRIHHYFDHLLSS